MTEERFTQVLSTKNSDAVVALPESAFDDPGPLGPSTYYYTARWLDSLVPADMGLTPPSALQAGVPAAAPAAVAAESSRPLIEPGPDDLTAAGEIPPALVEIGGRSPVSGTVASAPRARVRYLYRLAFEHCAGLVQREAGLSLVAAAMADARAAVKAGDDLRATALWNELLSESRSFGDRFGPDPDVRRARLEALYALGRDAELVRECADFRDTWPDAANDDALLYYEGASSRRLGKKLWAPSLYTLLVDRPVSDWTGQALDFVSALGAQQTEIGPEALAVARMRLAVRDRDYGPAWRAALSARSIVFAKSAPRNLVADAGKACLYSNSSREGLLVFAYAFGNYPADSTKVRRSQDEAAAAWTATYYRARFLRGMEKWQDAAALFGEAASGAPTMQDADSARWYEVDCKMKAAKKAQDASTPRNASAALLKKRASALRMQYIRILLDASYYWTDPTIFSDLADSLLRDAIQARDWPVVREFATKLGARLSPLLEARSAYVAGRVLELHIDEPPPRAGKPAKAGSRLATATPALPPQAPDSDGPTLKPTPADFYLAVANRSGAPTYYRILALRRLGEDVDVLPPPTPTVTSGTSPAPREDGLPPSRRDASVAGAEKSAEAVELEDFFLGFVKLGLNSFVLPELISRPPLDPEATRRVARAIADKGDYDSSMRIILALADRPGWVPTRGDYELLYPRPFLDELRAVRPRPNAPEYLLYGLLRSESFFRPDVVSSAGAVGLAQIMPATAEEIARGLGMEQWDLTTPADNLRMGSQHFSDLVVWTDGHPMRAMFAYNAGGARLRKWVSDSPGLPDDLLLECLSIDETRQYGRNILQAAVFYAELYYDMQGKDVVDEVLGKGAVPTAR
jgi:hypothetical protein